MHDRSYYRRGRAAGNKSARLKSPNLQSLQVKSLSLSLDHGRRRGEWTVYIYIYICVCLKFPSTVKHTTRFARVTDAIQQRPLSDQHITTANTTVRQSQALIVLLVVQTVALAYFAEGVGGAWYFMKLRDISIIIMWQMFAQLVACRAVLTSLKLEVAVYAVQYIYFKGIYKL